MVCHEIMALAAAALDMQPTAPAVLPWWSPAVHLLRCSVAKGMWIGLCLRRYYRKLISPVICYIHSRSRGA